MNTLSITFTAENITALILAITGLVTALGAWKRSNTAKSVADQSNTRSAAATDLVTNGQQLTTASIDRLSNRMNTTDVKLNHVALAVSPSSTPPTPPTAPTTPKPGGGIMAGLISTPPEGPK